MDERVLDKLKILAESAKYDVSCASSGTSRSHKKGQIGSAEGWGICHSFAEDGRCISLLKIMLTNNCIYDCAYCINRQEQRPAESHVLRHGTREPDDRILSQELHRGPLPQLGSSTQSRLHDGTFGKSGKGLATSVPL